MGAILTQINISDGGMPKLPVSEAYVTQSGVPGDRQRNTKFHAGPDRADFVEMGEADGQAGRKGNTKCFAEIVRQRGQSLGDGAGRGRRTAFEDDDEFSPPHRKATSHSQMVERMIKGSIGRNGRLVHVR